MKIETRRTAINHTAEANDLHRPNEQDEFRNNVYGRDFFENAPLHPASQVLRTTPELAFAKMGLAVVNSSFTAEHIQKLIELVGKSEEPLYFLVEAKDDGQIAGITSFRSKADWLANTEERKGWLAEEVWNAPPLEKERQLAFLRAQIEFPRRDIG